jgi:hypothetical protein
VNLADNRVPIGADLDPTPNEFPRATSKHCAHLSWVPLRCLFTASLGDSIASSTRIGFSVHTATFEAAAQELGRDNANKVLPIVHFGGFLNVEGLQIWRWQLNERLGALLGVFLLFECQVDAVDDVASVLPPCWAVSFRINVALPWENSSIDSSSAKRTLRC